MIEDDYNFLVSQFNEAILLTRYVEELPVHPRYKEALYSYYADAMVRRAAGGWSNDNVLPEHRYLNVTGGFLAVTAERRDGTPTLILHHYSVDGEILNEEVRLAE